MASLIALHQVLFPLLSLCCLISRLAATSLFACLSGAGRTGETDGHSVAARQHDLSPGLDARPAIHASGRRLCLEKRGRPEPSVIRLRAPLHARETRSTVCAGRAAGSGLLSVRLERVSRACGLGRRGFAPRLSAGPWAGLYRLGPLAKDGSPRPLSTGMGPVRFRGQRAAMPWPRVQPAANAAPLRRPASAQRLRTNGLRGHGTGSRQTVRGVAA